QSALKQLALKVRMADLAARMRLNLALASEAEKSAVLAVTDEESRAFADQARTATAEVERKYQELEKLLAAGGTHDEKDLLAQFSMDFAEFQRIDHDLLALAVKNTNIKAYNLAYGPAMDALNTMNTSLLRLLGKSNGTAVPQKVYSSVFAAINGAWQIQVLLPQHIAEESDKKMDELDRRIVTLDQSVRQALAILAEIKICSGDPDLKTATAKYAEFSEIRGRIPALSRENTNVRSLALSLGRKRKVMFLCQDDLAALQQAIQAEPSAAAPNPRSLEAR
ncbi:MAG: hypothetical protein NT056_10885, partial [Proteobacteria bacterium]|nr:hypothetical protein [Pseudomonadota bacterium]